MYQVNPLNRNVLITAEEVLFHGATSHTTDIRMIEQAIILAEERFIKKSICKEFYEDFRNKKNVIVDANNLSNLTAKVNISNTGEAIVIKIGDIVNAIELVTDPWYQKLWFEFLWKLSAECVIYTATPTNFSEYTSQGEMINNPKNILSDGGGAVSATHKEVSWKMDKMLMDRIDPFLQSMHEWLCDNRQQFPLYTCKACACNEDGVSHLRKSGWIQAYKKDNEDGCCDFKSQVKRNYPKQSIPVFVPSVQDVVERIINLTAGVPVILLYPTTAIYAQAQVQDGDILYSISGDLSDGFIFRKERDFRIEAIDFPKIIFQSITPTAKIVIHFYNN